MCICFVVSIANALANAACERCKSGFAPTEKIVNSNGELYHEQCFVCAQCFQQFPEGLFYEVVQSTFILIHLMCHHYDEPYFMWHYCYIQYVLNVSFY